ncbi:phosphotransferase [Erwinia sp. E_sp_W01_6]
MDIHAGNVIRHNEEIRLIDWEYASDGDVALELAAIVAGNNLDCQQQTQLIAVYAQQQKLDPSLLGRQMRRWQPWLRLLMASWYELRWQQSQDAMFFTLAAEAWQRVLSD